MKQIKLILALGLLVAGLGAQAQTQVNGVWYYLDSPKGEAMVVVPPTGTYSGDIEIPSTFGISSKNYAVVAIGEKAFENCDELTSVSIGEEVKTIHEGAFYGCDNLATVTFNEGSKLEEICYQAFANCYALKEIELPASLKKLRAYAFSSCYELKSLHIPAAVELIEGNPVNFCTALTEITVDEANISYKAVDGVLFTVDGMVLMAYPNGKETAVYAIPDGVEEIENYAIFHNTFVENVTFPASLVRIGSHVFGYSEKLQAVELNEGLEYIGPAAFEGCDNLESILLPSTLISLDYAVFENCKNVKMIACKAMTPPTAEYSTFDGIPAGTPLYVPTDAMPNYTTAPVPWDKFDIKDLEVLEKRAELIGLCEDMEDMAAFAKAMGIPDSYLTDLKDAYNAALAVAEDMSSTKDQIEAAIIPAKSAINGAAALLITPESKGALKAQLDALLVEGDSEDCQKIVEFAKNDVDNAGWDFGKSVGENLSLLAPLTTIVDDVKAALDAQRAAEELETYKEILEDVMIQMNYVGYYVSEVFDVSTDPDYDALYAAYGAAYTVLLDPYATLEQVVDAINAAEVALNEGITKLIPKMKYAMKEQLDLLVAGLRDDIVQIAEDAKNDIDNFTWDYMESAIVNIESLYDLYAVAKDKINAEKEKISANEITNNSALIQWPNTGATYSLRYKKALIMDFESGLAPFTEIDADGDGFTWFANAENAGKNPADGLNYAGLTAHSGDFVAYTQSYSNISGALTPDNWLVSPLIKLGGSITFWAIGEDASYAAEHFGFYLSTSGNTPESFTEYQTWDATASYVDYSVDYSGVEGKGYVAIRHFDITDMYMMNVDDIEIYEGPMTDWVQFDGIEADNFLLQELEEDFYYSVQISEDGGANWSKTCLFKTTIPTDVESVEQTEIGSQKVLRNGQLFIIKNGKNYNVLGAEVK